MSSIDRILREQKLIEQLIKDYPNDYAGVIVGLTTVIRKAPLLSLEEAITVAKNVSNWAIDLADQIMDPSTKDLKVEPLGNVFEKKEPEQKASEDNIDLMIDAVRRLMEEAGCTFHKAAGNEAMFNIPKTSRLHDNEQALRNMSAFASGMGVKIRVKKEL